MHSAVFLVSKLCKPRCLSWTLYVSAIHYKLNGPPRRLYNIHSLGVIEHNTCEVCTDFDRLWCTSKRVENIHDHFMIYPVNIWSTGGMFHQCCVLTKIFWVKKFLMFHTVNFNTTLENRYTNIPTKFKKFTS